MLWLVKIAAKVDSETAQLLAKAKSVDVKDMPMMLTILEAMSGSSLFIRNVRGIMGIPSRVQPEPRSVDAASCRYSRFKDNIKNANELEAKTKKHYEENMARYNARKAANKDDHVHP